jgi:hypothetical protein
VLLQASIADDVPDVECGWCLHTDEAFRALQAWICLMLESRSAPSFAGLRPRCVIPWDGWRNVTPRRSRTVRQNSVAVGALAACTDAAQAQADALVAARLESRESVG